MTPSLIATTPCAGVLPGSQTPPQAHWASSPGKGEQRFWFGHVTFTSARLSDSWQGFLMMFPLPSGEGAGGGANQVRQPVCCAVFGGDAGFNSHPLSPSGSSPWKGEQSFYGSMPEGYLRQLAVSRLSEQTFYGSTPGALSERMVRAILPKEAMAAGSPVELVSLLRRRPGSIHLCHAPVERVSLHALCLGQFFFLSLPPLWGARSPLSPCFF